MGLGKKSAANVAEDVGVDACDVFITAMFKVMAYAMLFGCGLFLAVGFVAGSGVGIWIGSDRSDKPCKYDVQSYLVVSGIAYLAMAGAGLVVMMIPWMYGSDEFHDGCGIAHAVYNGLALIPPAVINVGLGVWGAILLILTGTDCDAVVRRYAAFVVFGFLFLTVVACYFSWLALSDAEDDDYPACCRRTRYASDYGSYSSDYDLTDASSSSSHRKPSRSKGRGKGNGGGSKTKAISKAARGAVGSLRKGGKSGKSSKGGKAKRSRKRVESSSVDSSTS